MFLQVLLGRGGPTPSEYSALAECFNDLFQKNQINGSVAPALRSALLELGGPFADHGSLVGLVLTTPRHGRYDVMERIYSNALSNEPAYRKWDAWFQTTAAAEAVRRRKDFLVGYLNDVAATAPAGSVIAVLGCGSCREVFEHLDQCGPQLRFDCVDVDEDAIGYAKSLGSRHRESAKFLQMNVFGFRPRNRYFRIVSAGLFDYLSDRSFVTLLKRWGRFLCAGGELLIGNFSPRNATRGPMGCAGWILHERSADELLLLARTAGYPAHHSWIGTEETGLNLFLGIRVPYS